MAHRWAAQNAAANPVLYRRGIACIQLANLLVMRPAADAGMRRERMTAKMVLTSNFAQLEEHREKLLRLGLLVEGYLPVETTTRLSQNCASSLGCWRSGTERMSASVRPPWSLNTIAFAVGRPRHPDVRNRSAGRRPRGRARACS